VKQAFTLIELIISIGIIVTIGSIIIIGQNDFNRSVKLQNLAHEIATLIRDTQSRAVNVDSSGSDDYFGYGLYLAPPTASGSDGLDEIVVFRNPPNNTSVQPSDYEYDAKYTTTEDTIIETMVLPPGFKIKRILSNEAVTSVCPFVNRQNDHPRTIAFARPEMTAMMTRNNATNRQFLWMALELYSESDPTQVRYVNINASGLIYTSSDLPSC